MAITAVEYKKKRTGTRYNADKKCYIGYRIDVWVNNVRYRNKRFPTRKEAENYIDSLKIKNTYSRNGLKFSSAAEIPRLSELCAKRLGLIKLRSEKVQTERVFKYLENLIGFDLRVTEIRSSHFQLFINARLADGVKPETVNREINSLSPPFKAASQMFPEMLDGFEPPRIPRVKTKRSGRTRVITEREKNLICAHLRKEKNAKETQKKFENRVRIGRMFEIAWQLGLRFGEIAKLKKTDFEFKEKTLKVHRWKTGAFTVFEYLPEFICHQIKRAAEDSQSEFIYTISGNYPKNFYAIIKEAVESNGMIYGREAKDGITFHSNRHSFTTRLIQNTDLATAQNYTGLSTKDLLGYYGHATDESKRAAMKAMYGGTEEFSIADLREIFERVRGEKMDFAEFCEKISGIKFSEKGTIQTRKLKLVK